MTPEIKATIITIILAVCASILIYGGFGTWSDARVVYVPLPAELGPCFSPHPLPDAEEVIFNPVRNM